MRALCAGFLLLGWASGLAAQGPLPPYVEARLENGKLVASRLRAGTEGDSDALVLRGIAVVDPLTFDYAAGGFTPKGLPALLRRLFNVNALRVAVHPGSLRDDPERVWRFVDEVRDAAAELGLYTILDLHAIGHPYLPQLSTDRAFSADPDFAAEFWREAARRYKDKPDVIFELFNEPFGAPIQAGATLKQAALKRYFSELVAALIEEGSESNLILLGGPQFSSELSGFSRDPLLKVTIHEGTPLSRVVDVSRRVAYSIHFYASRPNSGGPRGGLGAVVSAMRASLPDNLAVVVGEWGFTAARSQSAILDGFAVLGRMNARVFLDRVAADPAYFETGRLDTLLGRFRLDSEPRRQAFCRSLYDGSLLAAIHAALTPSGKAALAAGGVSGLLSPNSPLDGTAALKAKRALRDPSLLELAAKPGFREALRTLNREGVGSVAWVFAEWGGIAKPGRFGPKTGEKDLSEYGRFLRKLFDGGR